MTKWRRNTRVSGPSNRRPQTHKKQIKNIKQLFFTKKRLFFVSDKQKYKDFQLPSETEKISVFWIFREVIATLALFDQKIGLFDVKFCFLRVFASLQLFSRNFHTHSTVLCSYCSFLQKNSNYFASLSSKNKAEKIDKSLNFVPCASGLLIYDPVVIILLFTKQKAPISGFWWD